MDVKPWVVDVTQSVHLEEGNTNEVDYTAWMLGDDGQWVQPPASQSGYIIMSSHLIYYYDDLSLTTAELQLLTAMGEVMMPLRMLYSN